jgi:hypothetical protein
MSAVRFDPNVFSNCRCACTHPFIPPENGLRRPRSPADVVDEHPLGRVADIEVQVDVAIVFTGKFVASSPRNVACS